MFLIEAGKLFLRHINFFECQKVQAHSCSLRPHCCSPSTSLSSSIPRSTGTQRLTELLNVDFRDPKLQLKKKWVFLGSKARSFIAKMGLTSEYPELGEFFAGVTG
jgi:hypothetical protein